MRHSRFKSRFAIRSLTVALLLATLASVSAAQSDSSGNAAERQKIRTVVESYLHGLKFNDVASLRAAFWPDAKLFFVKRDSTLGQLSQEDWYKGFAASAGKEEQGDLRIESIDISGNAASVKVIETYPKSIYIDYLNLLRFDGRWRIVNKIYTSHAR